MIFLTNPLDSKKFEKKELTRSQLHKHTVKVIRH